MNSHSLWKSGCQTHLCQVDSSTSTLWTGPFPIEWVSILLLYPCFIEIPVLNVNNQGASNEYSQHVFSRSNKKNGQYFWLKKQHLI